MTTTSRAHKTPEGTYRIRLTVGKDAEGKVIRKSITADTRREAERAAQEYLDKLEEQRAKEAAGPTVAETLESYIGTKSRCVSPATLKSYYSIAHSCLGDFGEVAVSQLTQTDVQMWINDLAATHSAKTCVNAHGLLVSMLASARPDLTLRTTLPRGRKKDIYVPTTMEVQDIAARLGDNPLIVPFLLATQCGLRASEIAGLKTDCITSAGIVIKQARVDGINGAEDKAPKSAAGYRTIPCSEHLKSLLRAGATEDGYVTTMRSVNISNNWIKWRNRNGLPEHLNFHALRHYFASKCLLQGMEQRYIAALMGHSDTKMIERVYQHVYADELAKRGQRMVAESDAFFAALDAARRGA